MNQPINKSPKKTLVWMKKEETNISVLKILCFQTDFISAFDCQWKQIKLLNGGGGPSARWRRPAAGGPRARPLAAGNVAVPPLLSVQPTWTTCRFQTEQSHRNNFPRVCASGFKWRSGAFPRHKHKLLRLDAETSDLRCGRDSPERGYRFRRNLNFHTGFFFFFGGGNINQGFY